MPTNHTTCPDCGAPAPQTEQSFCDSCGAFLRWDRPVPRPAPSEREGTAAASSATAQAPDPRDRDQPASHDTTAPATPAAAPLPPAAPPAPPGHVPAPGPGTAEGDSSPSGGVPQQGAEDPTAPLPPAAPHDGDEGRRRSAQDSQAGQSGPSTPRPAGERGISETGIRALLVPVPGATAAPPPEAPGVLPGRPEAARPKVRTPQAAPEPENGAPCRSCGALNAPGRYFCRSCAIPLAEPAAETAEGPYAGQRPRLHRNRTKWITRAVVAAVIAAAVVGGIIGVPPAARAVQDHFAKRVPVPAGKWKASHSGPGHDAKLAFDTYSNTWWGTGYSGNSNGQYLEATFGQPTDLLNVLITPGASARPPQAADPARPHEFDLVVTDTAAKQHIWHLRINDGGAQKIDVPVRDAMSVRLVLRSAYGATDEKQVAIAEMEFFSRSTR